MVGVECPRLRVSAELYMPEAAEAQALCYLASYAGSEIPSRVTDSYKLAFGITTINYFPRITGGRPGFLIAKYVGGDTPKVVVAIEGTTTLRQIWGLGSTVLATTYGSTLPGRVYGSFANHATAIKTILDADPTIGAPINRNGVVLVVAGFSLGGACAEILAKDYNQDSRWAGVKLFTFGKPRVGNQRWNDYRPGPMTRYNFICENDPASSLPTNASTSIGSTFSSVPTIFTWFVRDPTANTYGIQGEFRGGYNSSQEVSPGSCTVAALNAGAVGNPWYFHQQSAYKLLFANWANHNDASMLYRLVNLEYPNDNTFWRVYRPGLRLDQVTIGIDAEAPFIPPNDEVKGIFNLPIGDTASPIDGGGQEWGGGSDEYVDRWNVITPQRAVILRRTRLQRN